MKSFWNWITILITVCAIILPISNIIINCHYAVEGFGIANSLTLCAIFITILSTLYSNYRNDLRIKQQMKENQESLFIQLRFDDAKIGLNDLIICLELTLGLYKQLLNLSETNIPEKDNYLTPRAFLVMQFINIISDYELMLKLPITFRTKLETTLINKYDENNSEKLKYDQKFNEILIENEYKNDYINQFNIITSNKYPKKVIQNYIKYKQFIKKFNRTEDIEMHETMFKYYYGFKKIKTEDFYNHFNNIYQELVTTSTEEIILKDKIE